MYAYKQSDYESFNIIFNLCRPIDETEPVSADCDDGLQCDGEVMDEDEWSDEECEGV